MILQYDTTVPYPRSSPKGTLPGAGVATDGRNEVVIKLLSVSSKNDNELSFFFIRGYLNQRFEYWQWSRYNHDQKRKHNHTSKYLPGDRDHDQSHISKHLRRYSFCWEGEGRGEGAMGLRV